MTVVNPNEHGPTSEDQIRAFEELIGYRLPKDYRRFLLLYNGGIPTSRAFIVEPFGEVIVRTFFGLHEGPVYKQLEKAYFLYEGRIPEGLLPIGTDESASVLAIALAGEDRGAIYFGDQQDRTDDGLIRFVKVADTFPDFIQMLSPEIADLENDYNELELVIHTGNDQALNRILEKLKESKTDLDLGHYLIDLAARYNRLDIVQRLVETGVHIDGLISIAAMSGNAELLDYLVSIGANINERDRRFNNATPLMRAVIAGHANIVRKLIEYGADIKATDKFGQTSLTWALRNQDNHPEIVHLLEGVQNR